MTREQALKAVEVADRRYRKQKALADELLAARNQAVLAALDQGVRQIRIAEVTGLSDRLVRKILRPQGSYLTRTLGREEER
jgi:hypothetical protein